MRRVIGGFLRLLPIFTVMAVRYDRWIAKQAAYYSAASFCDYDDISDWSCGDACMGVPYMKDVRLI